MRACGNNFNDVQRLTLSESAALFVGRWSFLRVNAGPMCLSESSGFKRRRVAKQTATSGLGLREFVSVERLFLTEAIDPSVPAHNQPAVDVLAL